MKTFAICLLLSLTIVCSLSAQKRNQDEFHVRKLAENVFFITEVLFHDVVNPPAAARFYSYSTLAANHIVSAHIERNQLPTIAKDYPSINVQPETGVSFQFAATYAMLETAKNIIPSGYSLEEKQQGLVDDYGKEGFSKQAIQKSIEYAQEVSKFFVEYAKGDGYLKLSTFSRYKPLESDSAWYPTPPEYMAAVEPYWNTIRNFTLDSASQFRPLPAVKFESSKQSGFYRLMDEVYSVSKTLTPEQKLIANYWDCNPFANFYSGHVNIAIKKISPGGHWMNITGIVCRKARASFATSVYAHALVAIGLHDGFVSCWDEKYHSHRVRPQTAINKFIDEKWRPLLETPPFPEYTSGHSVISTISALLLTHIFGENFEFTDTTEVMFGMESRTFPSFRAACNEAAISRFYGGIHYMDAIKNGQKQGEQLGNHIINKLKLNVVANSD